MPGSNREWAHASVSQIKTYRDCPRKWWWNKVVGLPTAGSEATELGGYVHAILEHRLKAGDGGWPGPKDLPEIPTSKWETALAIAKKEEGFLPSERQFSSQVEYGFRLPTDVVDIIGFIDWIEEDEGRINDHKTVGNMRFALDEGGLYEDLQGAVYAKAAFEILKWEYPIRFRHLQLPSRDEDAPARTVEVEFDKEQVDKKMAEALLDMEAMAQLAQEEDPLGVYANRKSCRKYGKLCDFFDRCEVHKGGGKVGSKTSLLARLGTDKPKQEEPKGEVDPTPVTAPEVRAKERGLTIGNLLGGSSDKPKADKPKVVEDSDEGWAGLAQHYGLTEVGQTLGNYLKQQEQQSPTKLGLVDGLTIYINCAPRPRQGVEITYFDEWVAPWAKQVAEEHRVADLRSLQFSRGKVALAERMMPAIEDGSLPLPLHLVVDRKNTYADAMLEGLIPMAQFVVERMM